MKLLIALAVSVLVVAVVGSAGHAQEPPLDLGDDSAFLAACSQLIAVGQNEGMVVKNCRRRAPDEINGNRALIHVRVATEGRAFELSVEMHKSLWNAVAWR